jgi:hypothetical protein
MILLKLTQKLKRSVTVSIHRTSFWWDTRGAFHKIYLLKYNILSSCSCSGHVMRRDESHIAKRVMSMNVDGHLSRGRLTNRWMDYVKDDKN